MSHENEKRSTEAQEERLDARDYPPGVTYLCPRCNVQAEVWSQQSNTATPKVWEMRCPTCTQTLGLGFDHRPAPPAIEETS